MRVVYRTSQFKKDVKRMNKRGKSFAVFKEAVDKLAADELLPDKYRDHQLSGDYRGNHECHLEPDWLLIYELAENELVLVRTGSHSDLFR